MSKLAKSLKQDPPKSGFRQSMAWLHTWVGLLFGWVLLFIFITGTAGYFDTEIDRWMQPELPPAQFDIPTENIISTLLKRLEKEAPGAKQWVIRLPSDRNSPYPFISWNSASLEAGATTKNGRETVDNFTGKTFPVRDTGGGQLLYRMHWQLHYLPKTIAYFIIGFAALFMLVALITGIITHKKIFKDFFTFRPSKGQRSWLDAHNVFSVLALPFLLMITYSGLLMMAYSYMPFVVDTHYDSPNQFFGELFDPPGMLEPAGDPMPLAALPAMISTAKAHWQTNHINSLDISNPGDRNARIVFYNTVDHSVNSEGERLVFDGVSGELLHKVPRSSSVAKSFYDVLTSLHEGLFAPSILRWLYFLSGIIGYAMVATGLVLWTVKRRTRLGTTLGFRLTESLNISVIAGLPAAIASYFWANRLLPIDIANRAEWEVHSMFIVWGILFTHAAYRSKQHSVQQAWIEQFLLAAFLYASLPVLNALTTDRHLGRSLLAGDWVFVGFDLTVFFIGLCFAAATWRLVKKKYKHPLKKPITARQIQATDM